jgi:hypothetical protein
MSSETSDVIFVEINDKRQQKEFKGISFSGFKKTDVKNELLDSLFHSKVEPACYWSAELICATHFSDLWDLLLLYYSRHIHVGNPKLAIYMEMRIKQFKDIVNTGYVGNEIKLRNNQKIRKLFCEIVCIFCHVKRKHSFDEIKVKKEDFDMINLSGKLKAPHVRYTSRFFQENDPKELFIACNELAYHLSDESKNNIQACFWIEWIMEFETICKNKKEKCHCERRTTIPVDTKFQIDIIWIVWDLLLLYAEDKSSFIHKCMKSLLTLFCLRYNSSCFKKKKFIVYFACSLLTENVNVDTEMIGVVEKEKIYNVIGNINHIYKQIKKNEVSPNMEYLFKDIKQRNLEKTIEKIELLNDFEESFIPRSD